LKYLPQDEVFGDRQIVKTNEWNPWAAETPIELYHKVEYHRYDDTEDFFEDDLYKKNEVDGLTNEDLDRLKEAKNQASIEL